MKKISRKVELNFKESSGKYKRTNKSTLTKEYGEIPGNALRGLVVSSVGLFYSVRFLQDDGNRFINCHSAGTIITKNFDSTLIAVGDYVYFVIEQDETHARLDISSLSKTGGIASRDCHSQAKILSRCWLQISIIY